MVNQEYTESCSQWTMLVPVPLFPVLCTVEQKTVVNLKLTIMPLEILGIHIHRQRDWVWLLFLKAG